MPNGESPVRFAARFRQVAAVRWLLAAGATPDVAALWFAGLRAEATQAAGDPRWRNAQLGPESLTPLHEAIQRNDEPLVRMLVAAGADLAIRDPQWKSRPLEWANALGRPQLAAIIERAM
jgi:ankyrin repeat protein